MCTSHLLHKPSQGQADSQLKRSEGNTSQKSVTHLVTLGEIRQQEQLYPVAKLSYFEVTYARRGEREGNVTRKILIKQPETETASSHGGKYKDNGKIRQWQSSGVLRRAVCYKLTDVSEVLTASIFTAIASIMFYPRMVTVQFRNVGLI
jgi:hypothetical protein